MSHRTSISSRWGSTIAGTIRRRRRCRNSTTNRKIAIRDVKRPAETPAFFVVKRRALFLEHDLVRKPVPTFRDHALERPVERAAVDQQVLAGGVAGLRRAQEGASRAELGRIAEAPRRNDGLAGLG